MKVNPNFPYICKGGHHRSFACVHCINMTNRQANNFVIRTHNYLLDKDDAACFITFLVAVYVPVYNRDTLLAELDRYMAIQPKRFSNRALVQSNGR